MMMLVTSGQDHFVHTLATLYAPWLKAEWEELWRRADLEALAAFWSLREHTGVLDALPALQVPCLLYAGDQDPMCAELADCQPTIANASFVGLPGLDHRQAAFEPDLILPHVRRFLSSLAG